MFWGEASWVPMAVLPLAGGATSGKSPSFSPYGGDNARAYLYGCWEN